LLNLYKDIGLSPIVSVDGYVYDRFGVNSSGQRCTTSDNSLKNEADCIVMYLSFVPKFLHTYQYFRALTSLLTNGDDLLMSLHDLVKEYYSADNIRAFSTQIGMSYHFEKEEVSSVGSLSFLGHDFQWTLLPNGIYLWLPVIDCNKMRSNLLIDNRERSAVMTVIRACAFRNETFACADCRLWFSDFILWLRKRLSHLNDNVEVQNAWHAYKTDHELWTLYSGISARILSGMPTGTRVADKSLPSSLKLRLESMTKKKSKAVIVVAKAKPKKKKVAKPKAAVIIKGKGAYTKVGGVAESLGNLFGKTAGTVAGGAGDFFSRILGLGAYNVRTNSLVNVQTGAPMMHSSNEEIRLRHREFLGNVIGSVAFTGQRFEINPGLSSTFPWMSTMARNYEQWQPMGLVVYYATSSGTEAGSVSLGSVIIATQYDPADGPFGSEIDMQDYTYSTNISPDQNGMHPVECDPKQNTLREFFVRDRSVMSGEDIRFYDLGVLNVYTVGQVEDGDTLGKIYLCHDIKLMRPKLASTSNLQSYICNPVADTQFGLMDILFNSGNGVPSTSPPYLNVGGPTVEFSAANNFNFTSPGLYYVHIYVVSSVADPGNVSITLGAGVTAGVPTYSSGSSSSGKFQNRVETVYVAHGYAVSDCSFQIQCANSTTGSFNLEICWVGNSPAYLPVLDSALALAQQRKPIPRVRPQVTDGLKEISKALNDMKMSMEPSDVSRGMCLPRCDYPDFEVIDGNFRSGRSLSKK